MTQRLSNRKSPSANSENCVTEEKDYRPKAIRLKEQNDEWEKRQSFQVLRPDSRTTIYRLLPKNVQMLSETKKGRKTLEGMEIHK